MKKLGKVRVIVDPKDITKDYFMDAKEAREKFLNDELWWNDTNMCYEERKQKF